MTAKKTAFTLELPDKWGLCLMRCIHPDDPTLAKGSMFVGGLGTDAVSPGDLPALMFQASYPTEAETVDAIRQIAQLMGITIDEETGWSCSDMLTGAAKDVEGVWEPSVNQFIPEDPEESEEGPEDIEGESTAFEMGEEQPCNNCADCQLKDTCQDAFWMDEDPADDTITMRAKREGLVSSASPVPDDTTMDDVNESLDLVKKGRPYHSGEPEERVPQPIEVDPKHCVNYRTCDRTISECDHDECSDYLSYEDDQASESTQ